LPPFSSRIHEFFADDVETGNTDSHRLGQTPVKSRKIVLWTPVRTLRTPVRTPRTPVRTPVRRPFRKIVKVVRPRQRPTGLHAGCQRPCQQGLIHE
jgi:hypothetical protein